ncbi:hypothetical protein EJ03DRAFT_167860 [Teratosphaeria nubilosa]|uniref:Uncharacterized protein n=1 Tax=Teratosphaeria nubilosa TaxID=161662 RepID=A0A6G1L1R0_9PEZI|nr:hypothetical protein EJ03DRAFT_167860 [Teratosphaeria nubilosa]
MPMTWTADADRRLLLLVLEISNVNNNQIAERWAAKHGIIPSLPVLTNSTSHWLALTLPRPGPEGGDQPTARAITERLAKLKKMANGTGTGIGSNAGVTPKKSATPRTTPSKAKKAEPKTPASSSKKRGKAAARMSDEDDSEAEGAAIKEESPTKRARLERRSKKEKKYEDPSSEVEDEEVVGGSSSKVGGGEGGVFDEFDDFAGVVGRDHGFQMDDLSDVSDFRPVA